LTLPYGIGQVAGMTIKYDSTKIEMNRVLKIKINGEDLQDQKKYTVSVSGYLATGGDGYMVFPEGRLISSDTPFQDALAAEFKKTNLVNLPKFGRIIDMMN
jgi:2',3'-cyclic-nucleotide 2'-phosphodiesterase (5'-nucleotidase family)